MRFNERKTFVFDAEVFRRKDTETALKIYDEYIRKHSPTPTPRFFEADRGDGTIDKLWHTPVTERTQFTREIDLPCINMFQKPDWRLSVVGITPQRRDNFLTSLLALQRLDYFPVRGDQVYWMGYRYMILTVVVPPEAYWQQTGVWMGLYCECVVSPEGDARPLVDLSSRAPSEVSGSNVAPSVPPTSWP